jgi:intracellular sulfur oxidation DsrE/DsrF family protein
MKKIGFVLGLLVSFQSLAAIEAFEDGPLIQGYGKHAKVEQDATIPDNMTFKVAFDVSDSVGKTETNPKFDTLARFLNMHVANGIESKNIELALVVHGRAGEDLLNEKTYNNKYATSNPNRELLELLIEHKVQVLLCGQSAAFYDIGNDNLIESPY